MLSWLFGKRDQIPENWAIMEDEGTPPTILRLNLAFKDAKARQGFIYNVPIILDRDHESQTDLEKAFIFENALDAIIEGKRAFAFVGSISSPDKQIFMLYVRHQHNQEWLYNKLREHRQGMTMQSDLIADPDWQLFFNLLPEAEA